MRLIESPFEIRPFDEFYQCERFTAQEDLYITRIIPVAPPGTHHTILSVEPNATEPDGTSRCGAFDENWVMLFASGVGSPPLQMPPGVALKVPAGHQIVMNLHLSNATDGVVSGVSAYDIRTAAVSDVKQVAGILVAGRVVFTVPRKTIGFKVEGECSLEGGTRLFGVFPHAHQLGRHIKIWTVQGDAETVVHDAPYEFEEQLFSVFYPIDLKEGDQIRVECTYDNPSEFDVSFGDSSTDEMCFAVSYVTPPFDLGSFGQVCIF